MKIEANSVAEYLDNIPDDRKLAVNKLRQTILENLPKGFEEKLQYGMPSYVVPHSIFPAGYHCNPKDPLPFVSIASQKNFVAFYHMGVYAQDELHDWFVTEYAKHFKRKLDMGKSCVRFKYMDDIPYVLIGQLMQKISVQDWVDMYRSRF